MPSTSSTDGAEPWPRDVWFLLIARFVRMLAFGSSSLILALFLSSLDQTPVQVGRFLTLTLVGDFLLSLTLTFVADSHLGRRNTLRLGAFSMLVSGLVFAISDNVNLLLLAAIFGVISPSGNEIGPFKAVEESILAGLVKKQDRPALFGWYVVVGSGAASFATWLGGALTDVIGDGTSGKGGGDEAYYRWIFVVYAVLGLIKLMLSLGLSERCEVSSPTPSPPRPNGGEADEREPLLSRPDEGSAEEEAPTSEHSSSFGFAPFALLCGLFAIDSFASGMVSQTITSWFLSRKFNADLSSLGTVCSAALLISSISNLFSARLANKLGLVPTMVFTHLPANIVCMLIPVPNSLGLTSALIVLRAATSAMDQAPRAAFLSAYVPAESRTRVLGFVNTVKTLAQSGGPSLTGWFADRNIMGWSFHVAGALKIIYDLGLLSAFSTVH